jgi:hypothetical protein
MNIFDVFLLLSCICLTELAIFGGLMIIRYIFGWQEEVFQNRLKRIEDEKLNNANRQPELKSKL